MKLAAKPYLLLLALLVLTYLTSCNDIIEPSLTNKTINAQAPVNQYLSTSYTINFWWDPVSNALSYHLEVVIPSFDAPGSLVLDTVITKNKFSFNLNPGNYQWRVYAQNGSSQTAASAARSFVILPNSIKQQSVQLSGPASGFVSNQAKVTFSWGTVFGATQYRFEIDTNNFIDEKAVVANLVVPGQQIDFTFPNDQAYQWRVRAENDTAQALWSAINKITYDHTPPNPVTLVSPADGIITSIPITLQWNTALTAIKYRLYLYKSDSVTLYPGFPLTSNTTSYSFNQGISGDKIFWKVTAVDAAGNESQASILRSFSLQ